MASIWSVVSLYVEIWLLKELRSLPAAASRFHLELRFQKSLEKRSCSTCTDAYILNGETSFKNLKSFLGEGGISAANWRSATGLGSTRPWGFLLIDLEKVFAHPVHQLPKQLHQSCVQLYLVS
ncbi:hypothetical protein OPV22_029777 [Ensete ventricosum]|uniref:Uncharacterized protein n=1 Tax=Ensete ventricosum TaxID=4639 RepID=A0AAV8QEB0_ENSVE|nr:hypothetical protein OPV22_029777 [Ensete ventricosum]